MWSLEKKPSHSTRRAAAQDGQFSVIVTPIFWSILDYQNHPERVTVESLLSGDAQGTILWRDWIRDALATGPGLLSVHSDTSREFDLDEAEEAGLQEWVHWKISDLMEFQKNSAP